MNRPFYLFKINLRRTSVLISIFAFLVSCNKIVDVDAPVTSTNAAIVYSNDATAISTLNNIYTIISQQGINGGLLSVSLYSGLSSDELELFGGNSNQDYLEYYKNSLTSSSASGNSLWTSIYPSVVFLSNSAIDGLNTTQATQSLTESVRKQLLGEAKFLRAYCYFYLVNLYGAVPLVTSSDYNKNKLIERSSIELVYNQIIDDLNSAKELLAENYLDPTLTKNSNERIAPNKFAASALLARVYLYKGDYQNAEFESNVVISNNLYDTVPLNQIFLINSKEVLWQLQSVSNSVTNTSDARFFLAPKTSINTASVHLSASIVADFEIGDLRRTYWIDSVMDNGSVYYLPAKYKVNSLNETPAERSVILRLAEQYLIRAESKARLGHLVEAADDINIIRSRAGIPAVHPNTLSEFLQILIHERRIELFTEYGHRWLDLKRYEVADSVLAAVKGGNWQSTDKLYPVPLREILLNNKLSQNPGY